MKRLVVMVVCDFAGEVTSIAVDDVNDFVYWGDITWTFRSPNFAIKRATLKGDDITVIVNAGKSHISR